MPPITSPCQVQNTPKPVTPATEKVKWTAPHAVPEAITPAPHAMAQVRKTVRRVADLVPSPNPARHAAAKADVKLNAPAKNKSRDNTTPLDKPSRAMNMSTNRTTIGYLVPHAEERATTILHADAVMDRDTSHASVAMVIRLSHVTLARATKK